MNTNTKKELFERLNKQMDGGFPIFLTRPGITIAPLELETPMYEPATTRICPQCYQGIVSRGADLCRFCEVWKLE